jgi:DNA-binding Lrp family transcriptional regulator
MDELDSKLILALRENGRASNASIAQSLGVNVATVARRIDALLNSGVISIKAVPDPYKFGYKAHAFITLDVDLSKVHDVCAPLIPHPNISLIQTCFGRFHVILIADFCDWESLDSFVKQQLSGIKGINKVEVFLVSEIKKRYKQLFADSDSNTHPAAIDKVDQQLVAELQQNGRLSYADLARKVGISLSTVSRHMDALLKDKIIKIVAVPDPSTLGYFADTKLIINVKPNYVNSVCEELSQYNNVYLLLTLMNGFEILAGVNCDTPDKLFDFITNKVAKIEGITNIETFIRAEIKKATYIRFPDQLG